MATQDRVTVKKIQLSAGVIHCCTSPDDGERVNAQIIETANCLVVVDAMLMRPYARQLRTYADQLGKPIERIFITHSHPDHWFGLEYFHDVPSYALTETIQEITATAQIQLDYHKSLHAEEVVDKVILPTHTIAQGTVTIDGLQYGIHKVDAAEDLYMLVIDLPTEKVLIAQDLIYNKVHMFVGQPSMDGTMCFDGWIAALQKFNSAGYKVVLPGHGVPSDAVVFQENIDQLEKMREIVARSNGDNFIPRAMEAFPEYGLTSMLVMSNFLLFQSQQKG